MRKSPDRSGATHGMIVYADAEVATPTVAEAPKVLPWHTPPTAGHAQRVARISPAEPGPRPQPRRRHVPEPGSERSRVFGSFSGHQACPTFSLAPRYGTTVRARRTGQFGVSVHESVPHQQSACLRLPSGGHERQPSVYTWWKDHSRSSGCRSASEFGSRRTTARCATSGHPGGSDVRGSPAVCTGDPLGGG
jgi:hypothetical protein